jgi:lysophospholipase L1-like esterase
MAAEEKIILVDLHPHFLDTNNKLDKRLTMDGLHLNAEGYKVWAKILKPYL